MKNVKEMTAAAVAVVLAGTTVEAETLHYYYVSGPAYVANQKDPADRVLLNTGYLKIDRSKLPDGPSLANRTIEYDWFFGPYDDPALSAVAGFDFSQGQGLAENFFISFDENENLTSWSFSNYRLGGMDYNFVSFRTGGDLNSNFPGMIPLEYWTAHQVLGSLGYRQGTKAYEDLFCGSWAGLDSAVCREIGEPSPAWDANFMTSGGQWFTNPLDFASEIERVTKLALADPPRSYHDIAPIPVPAPLGLLVVGVGAIAFVRRRARG